MSRQKKLMDEMIIDPEKVSNIIVGFLQKKSKEQNKDGIVLGLSGGVDSAVMAALAVKAVGASKVYALHLFDRDSQSKSLKHAQKIVEKLEINFEVRDITQSVKEQGIYKPLIMRITAFLPGLNRLIVYISRFASRRILRESPFILNLKRGEPVKNKFAGVIYNALAGAIESGFNARHIQRRQILETYASERNLLLIGAANKSESLIGWFVKDGVDDLPIEPLLELYKNQVRQLARFLYIPSEIVSETPSPDMLKGVTDELVIGFPYDKIDKVLYVLEYGLSREIAFDEGITPGEFDGIKRLNQLSVWKRENRHDYPLFA